MFGCKTVLPHLRCFTMLQYPKLKENGKLLDHAINIILILSTRSAVSEEKEKKKNALNPQTFDFK